MVMIKVPKTPKSAFNPDRPASSLIQAQIEHLEAAARVERRGAAGVSRAAPARARRAPIREGEAADYIARLTNLLHPGLPKAAPSEEAAAVTRELPPPATRRRARKAPRKAVKAKVTRQAKPAARSKAAPRKKAAARRRKKGR